MTEQDENIAETIVERVADILLVVANVGNGDYGTRLETDLPAEHPLTILYDGMNEMVQSLQTAQRRGEAYRAELEEKLATIEVQRAAIKELSTPIMEVWQGILCLPVVGVLDS